MSPACHCLPVHQTNDHIFPPLVGVGSSCIQSPRCDTRDRPYGRLWTTAAFTRLTIPAMRALGRAVHSPGLPEPLLRPGSRDDVLTRDACCELCARESEDDRSTSPTSSESVPAAAASVPMMNVAVSSILAHQNRSLMSERPLCRQQPTTM